MLPSLYASGGKMYFLGHLLTHIHIESFSSVNLCPVFYLKVYLCSKEPFRKKLYGFCDTSLSLGNRQYMLVCTKMISSWVRKVLSMAMADMSQGTLQGAVASAALFVGVSLMYTLSAGDWARVSTTARHCF